MQEKVVHLQQQLRQGHLTRRGFLRRAAALGVSVAAAEVLAACAAPTPTPTPSILGFVFPHDETSAQPTAVPSRTPEPPTRTPTPAPPWAQGATWSCPVCSESFATKAELLKHLEAEHLRRLPGIRTVDQPTYARFLRGVERFDQKDIVFMRVAWDEAYQQDIAQVTPRPRPATPAEAQEGTARVAGAIYTDDKAGSFHPAYYGYFGHLQGIDGMYSWEEPVSPTKVPFDSPAQASEQVKMMAKFYGADLVGVTEINNTWVYSHYFDRETGNYGPLELPYKYAVVMGIEMKWDEGIVESPDYPASAATALAYSNMAEISSKLAQYIRMLGYEAVPSGNDTTQSIPLAIDAGLGELGRHGLLITPQFGARQRICKVYTNLPLEPDQPIDFGVQPFCEQCRICAHNCPAEAIQFGDRSTDQTSISNRPGILRWPVDVAKCYLFWVSNVADEQRWNDCSNCVRACPWSHPDRTWL